MWGTREKQNQNMTPRFLTQASERVELHSTEGKVIGGTCLANVWGERGKLGVRFEYVVFEMFIRLSSEILNKQLETQVWNLGRSGWRQV